MKPLTRILTTLLAAACLLPAIAVAQPATIQVINHIPVEISTDCYREAPDSAGSILVLSSDCSLWSLGAGNHGASTVFYFNKPLPASTARFEYRIVRASDSGQWKMLSANGDVPKTRLLLGRVKLAPGQHCKCEIRYVGSGIIVQQQVIQRKILVPVYKGFRQHKTRQHGTEEALFSKSLQEAPTINNGTALRPGNVLLLEPGLSTDILLAGQGLNKDSSMEYSFGSIEQSNSNEWISTGSIIHLKALPGAANYVLQVRYRGMPGSLNFFVASKPHWYQHILFKVLVGVLIIGLLLGVPAYYYRYRSKRNEWMRRRLEGQLQLVHNQLNPHFIFNSLSSITNLISSGDNDRANEYLSVFSGMMRHTMNVSGKTVISLADDLDQMEQYLRIEQLRFQFRFRIDISPQLDLNSIELPPQLLQPSLENAVKHGASGLQSEGEVWLQVFPQNDDLHIRIRNNCKTGYRRPDKGQGRGLKFTREQVGYLQQLFRERDIRFDLLVTEDGAIASFFFENWLKPEI